MPRASVLGGRYLMVGLGVSSVDTERVPAVAMRYEDENFLVHVGDLGREGYEEYPPMVVNINNWLPVHFPHNTNGFDATTLPLRTSLTSYPTLP